MNPYLQAILEGKDGFSFGDSWRYCVDSLVAVLPILRKSEKVRKYLILKEAKNVEISDTGQINRIRITNKEKKPIYIRMGEIFTGKSQERIAIRSHIILPKESTEIEVRCVYASKPISTGEMMKSGGLAPASFDSLFSHSSFKMRSPDQSQVWKEVNMSASMMANSSEMLDRQFDLRAEVETEGGTVETVRSQPADDLKGIIDVFSKQIDKILKEVPFLEDQVGIALLDLSGVSSLECFDLSGSWKALRDDIIKKEGENLSKLQKESPFEYKAKKAVNAVKALLSNAFEEKTTFKTKEVRITNLNSEKYSGEITELNNELVHLVLVRKA